MITPICKNFDLCNFEKRFQLNTKQKMKYHMTLWNSY